MHNLSRSLPLGVAAGCAAVFLVPETDAKTVPVDVVAELRALGPSGLGGLLVRYDQMQPGADRDELALTIDQVAAQRYATVSRLYWYTDRTLAISAARTAHRPILALRMLGRLDEDLSCANSRLFRTTLYANAEVSKFLRDNFILYWSSERPVPKVTIDMGDGRKIERTTTGNSAHYVLDENGNVLDVLPGLYAPSVFKDELAKTLPLAARVRGLDTKRRVEATVAFHSAALEKSVAAFRKLAGTSYAKAPIGSRLAQAQAVTVSKAMREIPELAQIGIDAGSISPTDIAQWSAIAQRLWRFGQPVRPRAAPQPMSLELGVFDAPSKALIKQLHMAVPQWVAAPTNFDQVVARLEDNVIADTALNDLQLRSQIRAYVIQSRLLDLDKLNAWIYATVFHTPKQDAWLGLLPRTDFTGLPGDGVVMP